MFLNNSYFNVAVAMRNPFDELNNEKIRNVRNTNKSLYNCGGYALDTFNWFMPYDENIFDSKKRHQQEMVDYMLNLFSDKLRLINSLDEIGKNENAIAFRCGNNDFHFMIRKDNKIWYHKRGSFSKIERISKEDVFNDGWKSNGLNYDGKLYLLALQK